MAELDATTLKVEDAVEATIAACVKGCFDRIADRKLATHECFEQCEEKIAGVLVAAKKLVAAVEFARPSLPIPGRAIPQHTGPSFGDEEYRRDNASRFLGPRGVRPSAWKLDVNDDDDDDEDEPRTSRMRQRLSQFGSADSHTKSGLELRDNNGARSSLLQRHTTGLEDDAEVHSLGSQSIKGLDNSRDPLPDEYYDQKPQMSGNTTFNQALAPMPARTLTSARAWTSAPVPMPARTLTSARAWTSPPVPMPARTLTSARASTSAPAPMPAGNQISVPDMNSAPAPTSTPAAVSSPDHPTSTPAAVSSPDHPTSTPAAVSSPDHPTSTPAAVSSPDHPTSTPAAVSDPAPNSAPTSTPAAVSDPAPNSAPAAVSSATDPADADFLAYLAHETGLQNAARADAIVYANERGALFSSDVKKESAIDRDVTNQGKKSDASTMSPKDNTAASIVNHTKDASAALFQVMMVPEITQAITCDLSPYESTKLASLHNVLYNGVKARTGVYFCDKDTLPIELLQPCRPEAIWNKAKGTEGGYDFVLSPALSPTDFEELVSDDVKIELESKEETIDRLMDLMYDTTTNHAISFKNPPKLGDIVDPRFETIIAVFRGECDKFVKQFAWLGHLSAVQSSGKALRHVVVDGADFITNDNLEVYVDYLIQHAPRLKSVTLVRCPFVDYFFDVGAPSKHVDSGLVRIVPTTLSAAKKSSDVAADKVALSLLCSRIQYMDTHKTFVADHHGMPGEVYLKVLAYNMIGKAVTGYRFPSLKLEEERIVDALIPAIHAFVDAANQHDWQGDDARAMDINEQSTTKWSPLMKEAMNRVVELILSRARLHAAGNRVAYLLCTLCDEFQPGQCFPVGNQKSKAEDRRRCSSCSAIASLSDERAKDHVAYNPQVYNKWLDEHFQGDYNNAVSYYRKQSAEYLATSMRANQNLVVNRVLLPEVVMHEDLGFESTMYLKTDLIVAPIKPQPSVVVAPIKPQSDLPDEIIVDICPFSLMGMECKVKTLCRMNKLCGKEDCGCEKVHGMVTCQLAGNGAGCTDKDCNKGLHSPARMRVCLTVRRHHAALMEESRTGGKTKEGNKKAKKMRQDKQ